MAKHFKDGKFIGRNELARQAWEKRPVVEVPKKKKRALPRKAKHKKASEE